LFYSMFEERTICPLQNVSWTTPTSGVKRMKERERLCYI
jgi:hypothetical protein